MPVQTHKNNISNSLCFDACNVYAIYAEHTGLKTQKFQFSWVYNTLYRDRYKILRPLSVWF